VDASHATPQLANIRIHPIKSLDPVSITDARVGPAGGLELDRAWALYTVDNRWVNGKRTPAILRIRAVFGSDLSSVTLFGAPTTIAGFLRRKSRFPQDTATAERWFSAYFEQPIIVRHSRKRIPRRSHR
jgi:uncharacterized protein YcbX